MGIRISFSAFMWMAKPRQHLVMFINVSHADRIYGAHHMTH